MLEAQFASKFERDVKSLVKKRYDIGLLREVVRLVLEDTEESSAILKQRHNMHRLTGTWSGSNECHVAIAGDWLVIWKTATIWPSSNARAHVTSCPAETFDTSISPDISLDSKKSRRARPPHCKKGFLIYIPEFVHNSVNQLASDAFSFSDNYLFSNSRFSNPFFLNASSAETRL